MESESLKRIKERARKATESAQTLALLEQESIFGSTAEEINAEFLTDATKRVALLGNIPTKGVGNNLIDQARLQILQAEQLGLFTSYLVTNRNAIPSLLARLPIFLPIKAKKQLELLDADLAFSFETPFGRGRRFGPPVTIFDEDVLYTLLKLSERRLIGQGKNLPIPLGHDEWLGNDNNDLTVQVAVTLLTGILDEMGLARSGVNYNRCLASVKRLNHVSFELEIKKTNLYLGETWSGEKIRLIDVKWQSGVEEGLIYAQITPVIVKWMQEQFTYFDWDVRRKLTTENDKAVHRFLSTQGDHYKKEITYIADVVGLDVDKNRLKKTFVSLMDKLEKYGWCTYLIHGTGRSKPHILEIFRTKNGKTTH